MLPFRIVALLLTMLPFMAHAASGDLCRPLALVDVQEAMSIERPSHGAFPQIEAELAREVVVSAAISASGGIMVARHLFGYGDFVDDVATLAITHAKQARVVARSNQRHLLLHFRDSRAVTSDGDVLQVVPLVARETRFLVARDQVRDAGGGSVAVARGARIVWTADASNVLEFRLAAAARLEETSAGRSNQKLTIVRPERVAPAGTIEVQVRAPGYDMRTKPVVFCFTSRVPDGESGSAISQGTRFVSQTADVATFHVDVPRPNAAGGRNWLSAEAALGFWDRIVGVPVTLRAVGVDEKTVGVDAANWLHITNALVAAGISGAVILALFVLSALWLRTLNPLRVVGALCQHSTGRYSLSNVQIFLWTLLVIFALAFNWIATGELLEISNGILVLLGISGGTSVLVRTIDAKTGRDVGPAPTTGPKLKDLVSDDEGRFDLLRFQMLGFTVFTWCYVLVNVLLSQGLPDIPESFYMLMGISNTAYVGGKLPGALGGKNEKVEGPRTDLELTEAEKLLDRSEIKALQRKLGIPETEVLDAATRDAVRKFKVSRGIAPADPHVDKLVLEAILAA